MDLLPTNHDRADQASAALDAYLATFGADRHSDDLEHLVSDLITDLLHLVERDGDESESADDIVRRALNDYDEETVMG